MTLEQLKLPAASPYSFQGRRLPVGVKRHLEIDYDKTMGLIAKRLREDSEQVTQEALPTRWVDLLLHLDEQERSTCAGSQSATDEEVVEAELAARDQEKVLRELIRTEEPTGEATALLEDLRQKVARAVAGRH
jgi:hypothetical protein